MARFGTAGCWISPLRTACAAATVALLLLASPALATPRDKVAELPPAVYTAIDGHTET